MNELHFTIIDLNREIPCLKTPHPKEVVYTIVIIDWIREAFDTLVSCCRPDVMTSFSSTREEEYKKAIKFFVAIRSFIVAHPSNTSRHKDYGFDGSFLCEDLNPLKSHIPFLIYDEKSCRAIDVEGLHEKTKKETDDVLMYAYRINDTDAPFARPISFRMEDVINVASLLIDRLYALDAYLAKLKKKDYKETT